MDHLGCVSKGGDTLRMGKLNGFMKVNSRMVSTVMVLTGLGVVEVRAPSVMALTGLGVVEVRVPSVMVLTGLGVVEVRAPSVMALTGLSVVEVRVPSVMALTGLGVVEVRVPGVMVLTGLGVVEVMVPGVMVPGVMVPGVMVPGVGNDDSGSCMLTSGLPSFLNALLRFDFESCYAEPITKVWRTPVIRRLSFKRLKRISVGCYLLECVLGVVLFSEASFNLLTLLNRCSKTYIEAGLGMQMPCW